MSRKRISEARLTVAAWPAGALVFVLAGAAGCDTYTTLKDVPIDCTVKDRYDFRLINGFETVGQSDWWASGDSTPGAVEATAATTEALPEGDRCGSKAASVFRAAHNNDWGCLFGINSFGPRAAVDDNGVPYEGLSFWARARIDTTKGFTILLDDANTAVANGVGNCKYYAPSGQQQGTVTALVDGQNVSTSGSVTRPFYPDECGNSYSVTMLVTSERTLYPIPFSRFQQDPKPNRVPNAVLTQTGPVSGTGLLIDQLLNLIVRFPKEASVELWFDDLAFYRAK